MRIVHSQRNIRCRGQALTYLLTLIKIINNYYKRYLSACADRFSVSFSRKYHVCPEGGRGPLPLFPKESGKLPLEPSLGELVRTPDQSALPKSFPFHLYTHGIGLLHSYSSQKDLLAIPGLDILLINNVSFNHI
jgi:hypothetical protein